MLPLSVSALLIKKVSRSRQSDDNSELISKNQTNYQKKIKYAEKNIFFCAVKSDVDDESTMINNSS